MSLLKIQSEEQASGVVKAVYDSFLEGAGMVAEPIKLYSASPKSLGAQMQVFAHYKDHPTLSPLLLTSIRYLVAVDAGFKHCIRFNGHIFGLAGLSAEQVAQVKDTPEVIPLKSRELSLIAFVRNSVKNPDLSTQNEVERLRELDWSDADILDATLHGAMVLRSGLMMQIFYK